MRILTLCHEYPPIGGGAAAVCAALTDQYIRAGHSVVVVTMGFGDQPDPEQIDECEVVRISCGRRSKEMASAWEAWLWARKSWRVVRSLHREKPFDVTHSHFVMPGGIVARRLKRSAGVPFIVTPHGTDVPGYNRERMKLVHVLIRPWWRRICLDAGCIASASASLLGMIDAAVTGHRRAVIPNGFDVGRFCPLQKQDRILLCGRLVERKGFHYFLEAIRDLDLSGWEVDIVGDGPMLQRVRRCADRCRIPVHVHGWIANDDPKLAELYGRAMLFVFPSEWENFSIALLEGMSAGCAIIASDVAGNPEVLGNAGYRIPPKNIGAIRRAVVELTADRPRCLELGREAAERVTTKFDWKVIARRYLDVFAACASKKRERETEAGRPSGTERVASTS